MKITSWSANWSSPYAECCPWKNLSDRTTNVRGFCI